MVMVMMVISCWEVCSVQVLLQMLQLSASKVSPIDCIQNINYNDFEEVFI